MKREGPARRSIAYVMTHYPRVTQTFIAREIAALRDADIVVVPFAMNEPDAHDRHDPEAKDTFYLKASSPFVFARSVLAGIRAGPVGFSRTLALALGTAGTDVGRIAKRLAHFAEAILVWDECRRRNVGQIHAHFGQTPSTIAWFAAELGRAVGAGPTRWTFSVHCASEVYDREWTRPNEKLESADVAVCVCDHTRAQMLWFSKPALWHKVVVARCGIDLEHYPLRNPRPVGTPAKLLTVGRLSPAKAHLILLDAVARARAAGCDVSLLIVGGGELHDAIACRAEKLGISDHVDFVGEVPPDRVRGYLEQADLFCLPSLDEGLPVSMMEAMATGVPVVTTYVAGIPELAVDDVTAAVVPAANSQALASAIERLISDAALRERLIEAARRQVEQLHDERTTMPRFMRAIGI